MQTAGKDHRPAPGGRRPFAVMLPVVLFAAVALLFAYALTNSDPSRLPSALIGKPVPAFNLPPLAGLVDGGGKPVPTFGADDLRHGDVTVVNFFASWCVPCVQEHPMLRVLKQRAAVRLVGINHKDPEPGGLKFLNAYGNPFDAVGVDASGRASIEWGVYGMPETFVVDGRGRIAYKHVGPLSEEGLRTGLLPAIEKAKAAK